MTVDVDERRRKQFDSESDEESEDDRKKKEEDEETMIILNEIEIMNKQIHVQRNWLKEFQNEKKRLWNKYDKNYDTLEIKPLPTGVETLNLKSIDATDVASSQRTQNSKAKSNQTAAPLSDEKELKDSLDVIYEDKN